MIILSRARREPIDFAQIIGSCTEDGRKVGALWDTINLADGLDESAQALARYYIRFHKELLGVANMEGLLEPSASLANYRALELARDATGRNKVLCSNLSHISIAQAIHSLRLEPVVLDVDPKNFQVSDEQFAGAISKHGEDIAAIVATYGTTVLGHVERFAESEQVKQLRDEGVWLHIDAANFGYVGTLSRHVKEIIPAADTITIDSYKFVGRPGVALLLVSEEKIPTHNVTYYDHSPHTYHTTLSAGPVAAWAQTVKDYDDICGLQELANQCVEISRSVGNNLQTQGINLVHIPELSTVPIALGSHDEVGHIHGQLLKTGFSVGKIHINARDYEIHGIRIVVTPKVNPEQIYQTVSKLADKIVEAVKM